MNSGLNRSILEAALVGLKAQRSKLDVHIGELRRLLDENNRDPQVKTAARSKRASQTDAAPKRILSAEARARIAKAQKLRWAKARKTAKKR